MENVTRFRHDVTMSPETQAIHERVGSALFARMAELVAEFRAHDLRITAVYSTDQEGTQLVSLCSTCVTSGGIRDLLEGSLSSVDAIGDALGEKGQAS